MSSQPFNHERWAAVYQKAQSETAQMQNEARVFYGSLVGDANNLGGTAVAQPAQTFTTEGLQAAYDNAANQYSQQLSGLGQLGQLSGMGVGGVAGQQMYDQQQISRTIRELMEAAGIGDGGSQDLALMAMNPIARAKYEPVFKLMDIKVRLTAGGFGSQRQHWVLAKMMPTGQVRVEWVAPSRDTAGSLRLWDAMVAEFLDEVARANGIDIDEHSEPASAGDETPSSAGDT